jgi:hypothetical protein
MPMTKEQILAEARSLKQEDREELVEDLRQIVSDDELTPEQHAELRRRIEEVDRGEAELLDGETVMRELFEKLLRRRVS